MKMLVRILLGTTLFFLQGFPSAYATERYTHHIASEGWNGSEPTVFSGELRSGRYLLSLSRAGEILWSDGDETVPLLSADQLRIFRIDRSQIALAEDGFIVFRALNTITNRAAIYAATPFVEPMEVALDSIKNLRLERIRIATQKFVSFHRVPLVGYDLVSGKEIAVEARLSEDCGIPIQKIPYYSQGDIRWAKDRYDHFPNQIQLYTRVNGEYSASSECGCGFFYRAGVAKSDDQWSSFNGCRWRLANSRMDFDRKTGRKQRSLDSTSFPRNDFELRRSWQLYFAIGRE